MAFFRTKRCELMEMHHKRRKVYRENWTILIRSSWAFPLCLEGGHVNLCVLICEFWDTLHLSLINLPGMWHSWMLLSQTALLICWMKNLKAFEGQHTNLLLIKPFCACIYVCSVMSGSLPTRLLCPRDFPGKNIGMGCHFLFQGIFLTQGLNPGLLSLLHW